MNIEKYILEKIISFGTIPKNLVANTSYRTSVASKKQRECLIVP